MKRPIDGSIYAMAANGCTQGGWFWYCDVHDTHGNADSEREAWVVSGAHVTFHTTVQWVEYASGENPCYIVVSAVVEPLSDPPASL